MLMIANHDRNTFARCPLTAPAVRQGAGGPWAAGTALEEAAGLSATANGLGRSNEESQAVVATPAVVSGGGHVWIDRCGERVLPAGTSASWLRGPAAAPEAHRSPKAWIAKVTARLEAPTSWSPPASRDNGESLPRLRRGGIGEMVGRGPDCATASARRSAGYLGGSLVTPEWPLQEDTCV